LNENSDSSLGVVGSLGLLVLLGHLFVRRAGPLIPNTLNGLSLFNLAALTLATMGGAGSLLALLGLAWMRAYNRISVFIGFFALFAVVLLLSELRRRYVRNSAARAWYAAGLVLLLVGGILDQRGKSEGLPFLWLPAPWKTEVREAFESDAAFVAALEERLPPGSAVFQLPYVDFPEHLPINAMSDYDHFRGYVHSRTLRWSYGAMRGRAGDLWQREAARQPPEQLVGTLVCAGFAGIYLDRNGYADHGEAVEAEISRILGAAPLVSRNGRLAFFDLSTSSVTAPP
jgi:phosphoglycerol transferase